MKRFALYVPWGIALVSLGFALWMFAMLADASMSIDGARRGQDTLDKRSETAIALVRLGWIGKSRGELLKAIEPLKASGSIVKSYEDVVEVDEITLYIRNERVSGIEYF